MAYSYTRDIGIAITVYEDADIGAFFHEQRYVVSLLVAHNTIE
jgi:hypothetical protein